MNMNNHRLYIIIFLIYIPIHLISAFECDEHSNQDDISFITKVYESPIIVIGTSLNKNMDIHIRNLFNVTFLVECILKGRPTQRIIHIVQAGSLLGRRSCQRLNVNRQYIVFLEPFFDGTFRPADFNEVPYSNPINLLLEKTCGLSRTYPFTEVNDTEAALTNKCPSAVSIDCPSEIPKTTVIEAPPPTAAAAATVAAAATTTTTTTRASVLTTKTNGLLFGKDSIDLEALSLLLAEHQRKNHSLAFLQDQNHKLLFSDDEARKNGVNQLTCIFSINLIYLSFLSILYIIF